MEKQKYFDKVTVLLDLKKKRDQLLKEWSETVCWFGSERQQKDHQDMEKMIHERIEQLTEELKEARKDIPKETLRQWGREYYNR